MSDMCQSLALLAGPFLTPSDLVQALWGIGNGRTCYLDGSLYILGMIAVPMYMVFLCVYYVSKLKSRLSDAQFAHRIEKKGHVTIIVITSGLIISSLAMKVINPIYSGTFCYVASVPTGCNQNPEVFGECDPSIQPAVRFFIFFGDVLIPVLSLFGTIASIGLIFWHVLWRGKIFGSRRNAQTTTRHASETNTGRGENIMNSSNNISEANSCSLLPFSSSGAPMGSSDVQDAPDEPDNVSTRAGAGDIDVICPSASSMDISISDTMSTGVQNHCQECFKGR